MRDGGGKTIRRGLVLRDSAFQFVRPLPRPPNGIVHHSAIAVRGLSNVLWYSFRIRQELRKSQVPAEVGSMIFKRKIGGVLREILKKHVNTCPERY
jgi:hypothetical protein